MKVKNIIEFIKDSQLIGGDLSQHQETALRLPYGLPLTKKQYGIAQAALDMVEIVRKVSREITYICGRRGGKSDRIAGNIGTFEAVCGGHEKYLAPGERGTILLVAQDMRAARVLFGYIKAKFENSPLLSQLLQDIRKSEIDLTNNLSISIFPCSFRAPRGFSVPVAILDELAFFRHEGAVIDREVVNAIRPAQATFPNSKLIKISSPYSKSGELYKDFSTRHQREDLLVFKAASWEMNPSIPQSFLDNEKERDPEMFDREYAANFSSSISNVFDREYVENCVVHDRHELPYISEFRYFAGVDPSGGGADEFALSICHRDGPVIQDVIRGWRSKRPADVVEEAAKLLHSYNISTVVGDRYSGEWVRQAFMKAGIRYVVSSLTSSDALLELLPLINQGSIQLLDNRVQTNQLISLERRTSRTGKDSLGHPQGLHDDRVVTLALSAILAAKPAKNRSVTWGRGQSSRFGSLRDVRGIAVCQHKIISD